MNPYVQRFTIKARLTGKGPMRTWDKNGSTGNLCSVDLLDASGEIRATMFKEVATKYYDLLQEGRVYTFAENNAKVKQANKQYSTLDNEYELTFNQPEIAEADDDGSIPRIKATWQKLAILAGPDSPAVDASLDVVGVLKNVQPANQITSKKGNELVKRDFTLVDDSGYEVRCTLWGDNAKKEDDFFAAHTVAAFKGLKVGDFQGVSLSVGFSGMVVWDAGETMDEGIALKRWWRTGGENAPATSLSNASGGGGGGGWGPASFADRIEIDDIKSRQLGFGEKADFATFKGTLNFIKTDRMWYEACAQADCHKKVTQNTDGSWHCEKCQLTMENCQRRYMCSMTLADDSGQTWVSSFNETSLVLFDKMSADELASYREELGGDDSHFDDFLKYKYLYRRYVVKVRVKNEVWAEQSRVKCTAATVSTLNFADESRDLLAAIRNFDK